MVNVKIDSGEFPLMRSVDVTHQPDRSKVYTAWLRAFSDNLPQYLDALPDVIEDVFTYRLWEDNQLGTPEEMLARFGITSLDLDEPARVLKQIRSETGRKKYKVAARRHWVEQNKDRMTQQQMADRLDVSRPTIASDIKELSENRVRTPKTDNVQRQVVKYTITQYTKPETAAKKICEKFGEGFANALAEAIKSGV